MNLLFKKIITFPYRVITWMMLTRPIRFTRFGTFYILFSLGVGAAAINTGNNLLYLILGILLGLIVLSGFLSDSALWGAHAEWSPLESLYTGEKGAMQCRLKKGWFPGVAMTVESDWQDLTTQTFFVPWIPAKKEIVTQVSVAPLHRGYLTLKRCRYSTRFPFGLFQKSHTETFEQQWIVYPQIRALAATLWEREGSQLSRDSSNRKGLGSIPFFLREYREGDALRQMDWKMSAKRARLMVKEMEDEAESGDVFYLDVWPALTGKLMEEFISFLASLLFSVYSQGRPVGLVVPGRAFEPDIARPHLHRMFEFLALVNPDAFRNQAAPTRSAPHHHSTHDVFSLWQAYGH